MASRVRDHRTACRAVAGTGLALTLLLGASAPLAAQEDAASPVSPSSEEGDDFLDENRITMSSLLEVNLTRSFATLPLYEGTFDGESVWYVITDVSNEGLAEELGVNFAPRLANITEGCPGCAQQVESTDGILGRGEVAFEGTVDFSPERVLVPGESEFPPERAEPGAIADANYSPFVQIEGSDVVYNAPIVATGDGPFDVIDHADTHDRLMGIDPGGMTADLLFVRAFSHGEDIFYFSFDGSTPQQAVLERGTFTPVLGGSPFANASDHPGGARSAIFTFLNGQTGAESPPAQGADHVFSDGMLPETANLENGELLDALRAGGDAHNVLDSFTTLEDRELAALYSPLWDLRVGVWSSEAVTEGLNVAQTDANEIRQLAAEGLVTSPGGVALGSANIVINCPIFGFADDAPVGIAPAGDPASS